MDDDEEEMARLRQSKRHQAFEKKFDRAGARMLKEMQLKQLDESPSPQPPTTESPTNTSRKRKRDDVEQGDTTNTTGNDEDGPIVITEEQLKSLPNAFGKQKTESTSTANDTCLYDQMYALRNATKPQQDPLFCDIHRRSKRSISRRTPKTFCVSLCGRKSGKRLRPN